MADLERMKRALVAADAAGDVDAARALASAIRSAMPKAEPVGVGEGVVTGMGDAVQGGAQMLVNSLPQGIVEGVNNLTAKANNLPVIGPAMRAMGMVPATAQQVNDQVTSRDAEYEARRAAAGQTGFDPARMAGNVLATAPLAAALPVGGSLLGSAAAGAGAGAAMSAMQPITGATEEDFGTRKARQALTGAGVGAALGPVAYGVGRMIAPKVTDQVRTLADEGVQMTPGQIMGGGYKRVEDALTSIPLIGDQVKAAQRGSIESLNRAAVNRALEPLGITLPKDVPVGREATRFLKEKVTEAYDGTLRNMVGQLDDKLAAEVSVIEDMAKRGLPPDQAARVKQIIDTQLLGKFGPSGKMLGTNVQSADSELGMLAHGYKTDRSADVRQLGDAIGELRSSFQNMLERVNPPEVAAGFRKAKEAFGNMATIDRAAGAQGAVEGVFTPSQLSGAVRMSDGSSRRAAYSRGEARMQDLSDAARSVLPQTVPDSGTPLRGLVGAGLATGAGMYFNPAVGAIAPAIYGAYTAPAQRLAQALLTGQRNRPLQALGDRVANSGVTLSPLAAALMSAQSP